MGQAREDPVGEAIARAAPETLAAKAQHNWPRMAVLAILAGAFIAFGSVISLVVQSGAGNGPTPGPVLVLSGLAFSVGLILVMVAGAELFTGNTMMVLPAITGALPIGRMLAAWCLVWLGNLAGSSSSPCSSRAPVAWTEAWAMQHEASPRTSSPSRRWLFSARASSPTPWSASRCGCR
jgi:formate/nitrite transporter FocA (FNT family)